jgi:hypothetical protein
VVAGAGVEAAEDVVLGTRGSLIGAAGTLSGVAGRRI